MTNKRRSIEACIKVELRAAELGIDAPRGGIEHWPYSNDEMRGWAVHYWNDRRGLNNKHEEAGYLARFIFLTDD